MTRACSVCSRASVKFSSDKVVRRPRSNCNHAAAAVAALAPPLPAAAGFEASFERWPLPSALIGALLHACNDAAAASSASSDESLLIKPGRLSSNRLISDVA